MASSFEKLEVQSIIDQLINYTIIENNKEIFKNNMNVILDRPAVYELMKDANLLRLNENAKNYRENYFLKLLLKRKYNKLYCLYKLRNKLENGK